MAQHTEHMDCGHSLRGCVPPCPLCMQVSAETQKMYDDTMEEAQNVPNILNDVGKDIGNFICQ